MPGKLIEGEVNDLLAKMSRLKKEHPDAEGVLEYFQAFSRAKDSESDLDLLGGVDAIIIEGLEGASAGAGFKRHVELVKGTQGYVRVLWTFK